jgi:hypothetical protein
MRYLSCDFDGVIGDTLHAITLTHQYYFPKCSYEDAKNHQLAYFLTPDHCSQTIDNHDEKVLLDRKKVFSDFTIKHGKVFELFTHELNTLKNTRLSIVSSGLEDYIHHLLQNNPLTFDPILGFNSHHSKVHKLEMVMELWGVSSQDLYYLTDTVTDVIEVSRILPLQNILGCSWGFHGYETLLNHLPKDQILNYFEDIHFYFD